MSMTLIGVDMPECCGGCPCCHERYDGSSFCAAIEDGPCDIDNIDGYLPNCPAKPKKNLPVPHGRLIDAGAFLAKLHNTELFSGADRTIIYKLLENAPTIIEAEVEE